MEFLLFVFFTVVVWAIIAVSTKRSWLRITLLFVIVGGGLATITVPCLLPSRMAGNEGKGIRACKTFTTAEDAYRRDHQEFALSLQALYGEGKSNLMDHAFALAEGPKGTPKAGYLFKVLTAQAASAPGGKKSYLNKEGHMTEGYAIVAWPASWDQSGRNTFQVSSSGTIYQKDLGDQTAKIVEKMTEFDPSLMGVWIAAE